MASPPLTMDIDYDNHQADSARRDLTISPFEELTQIERERAYIRKFAKQVEPLHCIDPPSECEIYPDFRREIFGAYLHFTTFTMKVWVNYDAASKKFYMDNRANDCGKLMMRPEDTRYLSDFPPGLLEIGHVRFELGTPFRTLCLVNFRAAVSPTNIDGYLSAKVDSLTHDHPALLNFIKHICAKVKEFHLPHGQKGLRLKDLEELASMFCREPTENEKQSKFRFGDMSTWMDIYYDSRNPGFIDV